MQQQTKKRFRFTVGQVVIITKGFRTGERARIRRRLENDENNQWADYDIEFLQKPSPADDRAYYMRESWLTEAP